MEEVKTQRSPLIFNRFFLKVLGLTLMTLDHISYLLVAFSVFVKDDPFILITRGLGRMALPLFALLIVEGVTHTKSFGKYALRLGIGASIVSLAMIFIEYVPIFGALTIRSEGIIFLDLLLGALAVFCLKDKRILVKAISVAIIGYSIASTWAHGLECVACSTEIWFVPFFMRTQYDFTGVLLIIFIYLGKELAKYILSKFNGAYDNTPTEQLMYNVGMLFGIAFITIISYIFIKYSYQWFNLVNDQNPSIQGLSIFSCIFVLFYNGRRGYESKWFKYGCYLYYPVHVIILYLLFVLIF